MLVIQLLVLRRNTISTPRILQEFFQERQRDKDSPYNFNVPPQMSIDLDTYEKTGEAKITSLKVEVRICFDTVT